MKKPRTMFVDTSDNNRVWRIVLHADVGDGFAPCVLVRADDWRKHIGTDVNSFATVREKAWAEDINPLDHHGTYFHDTEEKAREWLGLSVTQ